MIDAWHFVNAADIVKLYAAGSRDFRGADFSRANLCGAILCDCNLDGAIITYRGKSVVVRFDPE